MQKLEDKKNSYYLMNFFLNILAKSKIEYKIIREILFKVFCEIVKTYVKIK